MPLIDIANVACGFHASDFNHMRATVRLAKAHGVKVGAHPSLPDLQGFGRREMKIGREELANCLIYQIGALKGFLEAEGMDAQSHQAARFALWDGGAARGRSPTRSATPPMSLTSPLLGMTARCMRRSIPRAGIGSSPNFTPISTMPMTVP